MRRRRRNRAAFEMRDMTMNEELDNEALDEAVSDLIATYGMHALLRAASLSADSLSDNFREQIGERENAAELETRFNALARMIEKAADYAEEMPS